MSRYDEDRIESLSLDDAKDIIERLGSTGTPPEIGVLGFSEGISEYLATLEAHYLEDRLKRGKGGFKLVLGENGSGKTHFLYSVREIAWELGFAVSYVELTPKACPFNKMDLVFKETARRIRTPPDDSHRSSKGICGMLDSWLNTMSKDVSTEEDREEIRRTIQLLDVDNKTFLQAAQAYLNQRMVDDREACIELEKWFCESPSDIPRKRFKIADKPKESNAHQMIRSLCQLVRQLGFRGLLVMFDEAERNTSIGAQRDKRMALQNLLQGRNEWQSDNYPGSMFFYGSTDQLRRDCDLVPALQMAFFDPGPNFGPDHESGIRIDIDKMELNSHSNLQKRAAKIGRIYEKIKPLPVDPSDNVEVLCKTVSSHGAMPQKSRIFVKAIVSLFNLLCSRKEELSEDEVKRLVEDAVLDFSEGTSPEGEY